MLDELQAAMGGVNDPMARFFAASYGMAKQVDREANGGSVSLPKSLPPEFLASLIQDTVSDAFSQVVLDENGMPKPKSLLVCCMTIAARVGILAKDFGALPPVNRN